AALLAFVIFYKASQNSKSFLFIALIWIFILSFLSLSDRYTLTKSLLPIFPLLTIPPTLLVIVLFFTRRGKEFIKSLNIKTLMILHFVRILVELGLFWLAAYKVVPESLTFEGRNFDILIGLTAPAIYYFGFVKTKLSKSIILVWNLIGLALLFNVVFNTVYTVLVLKQPNFALGYFPFFLLPSLIVPLVMFSHLASIRRLLSKK
ncbi:MAG TPA: hypothetical protein VN958_19585, partial [Chitinophagaceae bacterium]|nr:hypothetical protein [Chitinophagaceae bacterium]